MKKKAPTKKKSPAKKAAAKKTTTPAVKPDSSPYDDVPYDGQPWAYCHPDSISALGTLFGMTPPSVEKANILEVGCGNGANLLSIAASLPDSKCYGIDLSEVQIKAGQKLAKAAGLTNVELAQADFKTLKKGKKAFDYIIVHGVFSWISKEMQDTLLELVKKQLAPDGVAFVSYNCLPGWHVRGMIRDLMGFHTRNVTDPKEKIAEARRVLAGMPAAVPGSLAGYAQVMAGEHELLSRAEDSYVAHEHLEEENHPMHFFEFAEKLDSNGLQYVCEAELAAMYINRYPAALGQFLDENSSVVDMEQYLDFATSRMFRQSLIVHDKVQIDRSISTERIEGLYATAQGSYDGIPQINSNPETYSGSKGATITIANPLAKAGMLAMAESWPARQTVDAIQSRAHAILSDGNSAAVDADMTDNAEGTLREAVLAGATTQLVDVHSHPGTFVSEVSDKPVASALARAQLAENPENPMVTTLRHRTVVLDRLSIEFLPMLDGTNDRATLVAATDKLIENGDVILRDPAGNVVTDNDDISKIVEEQVDGHLLFMARAALFSA